MGCGAPKANSQPATSTLDNQQSAQAEQHAAQPNQLLPVGLKTVTSAENVKTARVDQAPTDVQQNPPDTEQSSFKVSEMYYRREAKDIAVIALENTMKHSYPLSLLNIHINGHAYKTNVLSFSDTHIRVFMQAKIVKDVKVGDTLECDVIRHELPVNFPKDNVFVIANALAIAEVIQLIKIYKLDSKTCDVITICNKQEDLIFKSSLKELIHNKSIELQENVQCLENLRDYFKNVIIKKQITHVAVIGPHWLLKLVQDMSKDQEDFKGVKFYGLQNLIGYDGDTEPTTSFVNFKYGNLDKCAKINDEDAAYEELINQFEQLPQAQAQNQQSTEPQNAAEHPNIQNQEQIKEEQEEMPMQQVKLNSNNNSSQQSPVPLEEQPKIAEADLSEDFAKKE